MSNFILSCTTCALRAPLKDEISETLNYAPKAGYKYWGIAGPALWTPYVSKWLDAERIKREAANAGLIGCTEVYAPQINTASPEMAVRSSDAILCQCEFAVKMDCPYVVFSGGQRQEGTAGLEATVAGLDVLLPKIESMPVKLALEPHFRSQFQDAEDYDFIFERVAHPQVGITVDTGHFHAAGVDTKAFIRRYAGKVWNIHLKDHIGTQSVAIGTGEIDLRGIFERLYEIGFEGALALEIEPEDTDRLPQFVAEAYAYLQSLIKEVTGREAE